MFSNLHVFVVKMNKAKINIRGKKVEKKAYMFVTMILCFFLINLLDPLGVNEVQYLLAEGDSSIDTGQAFLTVCWSSTMCDSVRRCS